MTVNGPDFRQTWLWRQAFQTPRSDSTTEEQEFFRTQYLSIRERAAQLVSRIAVDLPDMTVHDISHLDALWDTASLVAEGAVNVNPAEAFVLGGSMFKINTGCREQDVCRLRWEWEIQVPKLDTSVFIIPGAGVKNGEDRQVVLNRVAKSVVEGVRGMHPTHVFCYRDHPVRKINNSAWKRLRGTVGLKHVRVHDLKHTFGRRLRAAGMPLETRKVLLGHRNGDITSHYSAPELAELLEAANRVCEGKSGKTPALVVLKQKTAIEGSITV